MIKAKDLCILLRVQKLPTQHKFVMEGLPVTLARSCTPCSTRTLVGISLADGKNLQSIHSNSWIENLLRWKQKKKNGIMLVKACKCDTFQNPKSTLSLQYPESTTNMIPSTVREVSAMLVATIHFLTPSGA